MNQEEKRNILIKHYQNPINKKENNSDNYIHVNSNNESCIDNIDIAVLIEEDVIKDITFTAEACAISTASTSIMIKNIIGKKIQEVEQYINNFENMINLEKYDESILKEANVFDDIYKQNSRKTCALLPYIAIKKAIKNTHEN